MICGGYYLIKELWEVCEKLNMVYIIKSQYFPQEELVAWLVQNMLIEHALKDCIVEEKMKDKTEKKLEVKGQPCMKSNGKKEEAVGIVKTSRIRSKF